MNISRSEQRVLHVLARGGIIAHARDHRRKISGVTCLTHDGLILADCTLALFARLRRRRLIQSRDGGGYRISPLGRQAVRAQPDNRTESAPKMTDPVPVIRPARAADTDALIALVRATGLFAAEDADDFAAMIRAALAAPSPGEVWLVRTAPEIVGAAYLGPETFAPDIRNLWFIGVHASARRQGHGRALLGAAEQAARDDGARLLLVETSSNPATAAARACYDACGYGAEARIRDYYAPGDDKVIFRKPLAAS